jgi:hypothetical protein
MKVFVAGATGVLGRPMIEGEFHELRPVAFAIADRMLGSVRAAGRVPAPAPGARRETDMGSWDPRPSWTASRPPGRALRFDESVSMALLIVRSAS